ncbi:hypothetical protein AB0J86_35605 [Micromonospora sp. NPDC049559]|uniref:terpene synthase family protein n=1 Tax=Micromonospora sp. NPDC049559 TaxID=3155923 RepID=UPI00341A7DF7
MDTEELLVPCPFPDRANPLGPAAAEYVRQVATEIGLTGSASSAVLHGMALGDAAALTYPDAPLERLRVATLWIAFLVLFDDAWSDLLELEGGWRERVLAKHDAIHAVLDGRPAPTDDPLLRVLHRILTDIGRVDPGWDTGRLRLEIRRYLAGTLWELDQRARGRIPDLVPYLEMRRVFSTMGVQRELGYFVWEMALPEAVRTHPCLRLVDVVVADYGCVANDLYSLAVERGHGVTSNIVTVLQHEYGWDEAAATAHAVRLAAQALDTFHDVRTDPARFGLPVEANLLRYFTHYEAFMSAAVRWPARSARYRAGLAE